MPNEVIALPEAPTPVEVPSPLPPAIQKAIDALDESKSALRKIRVALGQARSDRAEAKREYDSAFVALGESESAAALDGSTPPPALRKAAEKHQQSLLGFDARIAGLQSRESAAVADVDLAMQALGEALNAWTEQETASATQKFYDAVDRFVQEATTPLSVSIALNDLHSINVARVSMILAEDGRNALQKLRAWRDNAEMTQVIGKYAAIRQAVTGQVNAARALIGKQ